jgi:hypothetical protein
VPGGGLTSSVVPTLMVNVRFRCCWEGGAGEYRAGRGWWVAVRRRTSVAGSRQGRRGGAERDGAEERGRDVGSQRTGEANREKDHGEEESAGCSLTLTRELRVTHSDLTSI